MNQEMTNEESLAIMQQMIATSRKRIQDDGSIYLLWGVAVTLAALFQFVMLKSGNTNGMHAIGWAVLMPLAGIATGVKVSKMKKVAKIHTHFDEVMSLLWPAVGALMVILIVMGITHVIEWSAAYPIMIALYGAATFVSGGLLKLRIMQFGAASCWVLALISTQFEFQYQLLFLVAAIWVSYMIPGIILYQKAKKANV